MGIRDILGVSFWWFGRVVLKLHRLEDVAALPLGCDLDRAIELYGNPVESKVDEDFPEATEHGFYVNHYHECVAWVWKGTIHALVYFSFPGDPNRDLEFMFRQYGDGLEWVAVDQGYLYYRADRKIRLWCSAMPAIGVATNEYWASMEAYKVTRTRPSATEMA
jgi:hypothetical protein